MPLPELDDTIHRASSFPRPGGWNLSTPNIMGDTSGNLNIQKHDIVVGIENTKGKRKCFRRNVSSSFRIFRSRRTI